jgi:CHAT domain-containing protein
LTSTDIAAMRTDANLVMLNACNTAGNDGLPGSEGMSGLASAFFFSGARSLIVSLWPVEQQTASSIGVETMRLAAENKSAGVAAVLQRATNRVLGNAKGHLKHPSFWAPYVLVGDGNVPPFSVHFRSTPTGSSASSRFSRSR